MTIMIGGMGMHDHDFWRLIQDWLVITGQDPNSIEFENDKDRIIFSDERFSDHFREYFEYRMKLVRACKAALHSPKKHAIPPGMPLRQTSPTPMEE